METYEILFSAVFVLLAINTFVSLANFYQPIKHKLWLETALTLSMAACYIAGCLLY